MKRKIMSIVVFMLLITTTIVMIPDDLQIKAISGNEQDLYLDGYDLVDRGFSWNKYFNATTGKYVLETYPGSINYLDDDNTWKPINTTIFSTEKTVSDIFYEYGITEAGYQVYFSKKSSKEFNQPVAFFNNQYVLTMNPMDNLSFSDGTQVSDKKLVTGIIEKNSIKYSEQYNDGIDLIFYCYDNYVKSNLVIDNFTRLPVPKDKNCTLDYKEMLQAFEIVEGDENRSVGIFYGENSTVFKDFDKWDDKEITSVESIYFKDDKNNTVFSIPKLYAWDSNPGKSLILLNKTLQMTSLGNLRLEIHVPYQWLFNFSRTYPVFIDPTLMFYSSDSDGYVYKSSTVYNTAWTSSTGTVSDSVNTISIGQDKILQFPAWTYYIYRGFLFFNTSELPANANITNATLSIYKQGDYSTTNFDIVIQNGQPSYPHDPLQSGDYNKSHYFGNGGSINTNNFSNGYNDISMTNYSWINLNGTTKLCLRSIRDISGNTPTTSEYVTIYSEDYPDVGVAPKCIITYSLIDFEGPLIIINFAGNLSDSGGPKWRPPGESVQLSGVWSDGYYTNDSRQHEDWMYINLTVVDEPTSTDYESSGVSNVWLQWLNKSTWTNWTYPFINTIDDYWEFNTSGNITTYEGYNYSFNIVANDTLGNSRVIWWNKTGIGGSYTRRYVQLNCNNLINISYTPFYLVNFTFGTGNPPTYGSADMAKGDRLHHDQGPDGSVDDNGYLSYFDINLNDTMHMRYCGGFVGYFFDDSICIEPFELKNIYYHFWSSGNDDTISCYWRKERGAAFSGAGRDWINFDYNNSRSYIYWNNSFELQSNDYYLCTDLKESSALDRNFTDNEIFEFLIIMDNTPFRPSVICNRSVITFILLNVPNNSTLNISYSDSDNDNLSDWYELYKSFTHPILSDTDNDGVNDKDEVDAGTDPNDYTDS